MTWRYLPPWGTHVVASVALVLTSLLAAQMIREWRGVPWRERLGPSLLRLGLIGALVFVMLNPSAILPREVAGRPKLIVLVDTSASMATKDVVAQSRLGAALEVLGRSTWREKFEVAVRRFDRQVQPAELRELKPDDATGEGSDLAGALSGAVSELAQARAQAGVLLVSDGRATTEGVIEAARLALAESVPLWTYCVGGDVVRHDLWIETASPEVLTFAGAEVDLSATLRVAGFAHRSFRVEVLQDNRALLATEVVPDAAGLRRAEVATATQAGRAPVRANVTAPAAGEHRYVFRVAADPLEVDPHNNERAVFVRVVGDKVRVLVAEGQPHWDTKFLVQTLKRSRYVEMTAVYQVNANRHLAIVSAEGAEQRVETDLFPRSAKDMNQYDVIVLGRGCEVFFDVNTERWLEEFLTKRGGSLVLARGKPYGGRFQPLAKLEPVVWSGGLETRLRLQPTDVGRETAIFNLGATGSLEELLAQLPALDGAEVTAGEKPLAIALATGQREGASTVAGQTLLMAYQRYGQGRVLTVNATGLWRWAFGDPASAQVETVYESFWLSLLRWLLAGSDFLPGTDVALRSARRVYTSDQPLQFLVTTKDLDPQVYRPRLVISGGGPNVEVEPRPSRGGGGYLAEVGPFSAGRYTITLRNNIGTPAEITQMVEVMPSSVEKQELSADRVTMEKLATISTGQSLSAADVPRLADVVTRWQAARQLSEQRQTVWDRWWLLGGMLGLLGAEWFTRRRAGLL